MALGDGIGPPPRSTADINIVPLVDVILVLLVIFIVTAPLLAQAVKVDLPQVASPPATTPAPPAVVAITADGRLHWDGVAVDQAQFALRARELAAQPNPELHIEADRAVPYAAVAEALAVAAAAGVTRIGFVTDPAATPVGVSVPEETR